MDNCAIYFIKSGMKPGQVVMIRTYVAGVDPYTVVKGKALSDKVEYVTRDIPAFVLKDFGTGAEVLYKNSDGSVEQRRIPDAFPYNWEEPESLEYIARMIQKEIHLGRDKVALYWTLRLINLLTK